MIRFVDPDISLDVLAVPICTECHQKYPDGETNGTTPLELEQRLRQLAKK